MNIIKKEKSKEEKLRELEFLFTSFLKKDVEFREDPVYMAIFDAIDRFNYEPFLPFDIEKDIRKYNHQALMLLKKNSNSDAIIGKSIGSRLKQLAQHRSILKILDEIPEIRRQKTFAVDEDIKEQLKEYLQKKDLKNSEIIQAKVYLDTQDVRDLLHVSWLTIRRWIISGKLKGYKLGRYWRFEKSEVEKLLEKP